jgi:hypothetical protein
MKQFSFVISFLFIPLFCAFTAVAQSSYRYSAADSFKANRTSYKKPPRSKPISRELSVGARLNTDGWSVFADKGYVKSDEKESDKFYNIRLFQVEFTEHKAAKEIKSNGNGSGSGNKPKPYKYGKINNFYAFKLGYGFRRLLAGKPDPGTVSIHWVFAGGITVGLLKPYYIEAYTQQGEGPKPIKYDDNPDAFLNLNNIVGRASFTEGLNEMKIVPGIHAKTALHFDFALYPKRKMAIETGLNAELYTQKMPIMAYVKAQPYIVNGYVSIQFGGRK